MIYRFAVYSVTFLGAVLSLLLVGATTSAEGQSIHDLRIGDESSRLASMGTGPSVTDTYKTFALQKWTLSNGDEVSATTSKSGKIVYLESDWGGVVKGPACDLSGIIFGTTTLTDIRKRFGSNGFAFENRAAVMKVADGVVMMNSYEIGSLIVTFITKISADTSPEQKSEQSETLADRARLDAVSISQPDYSETTWGKRIYDPDYKKAEWK